MQTNQQVMNAAHLALGLQPPVDLTNYDLRKEEDFVSWIFLLSQAGSRLRTAAGLS